MLRDFVLDVLAMRQGLSVQEPAILLHGLPLPDAKDFASWREFLATTVRAGDYVLGGGAASLVRAHLSREAAVLERVAPSLDAPNRRFCERKLALIQAALVKLDGPHSPELLKRWVNTGLYLGSDRAWALYLDALAGCLEYASAAHALLDGTDPPGAAGENLGCTLARVVCVEQVMSSE